MAQQQYERFVQGGQFDPIATPDRTVGLQENQQALIRDMQGAQQQRNANYQMQMLNSKFGEEAMGKLADFSDSIAKTLVEREKKLNEEDQKAGLAKAYTEGVPEDVQLQFDAQMAELNENEASTVRDLNDAVEKGYVSWTLAQQMREMSPFMRVGYTKGILEQLGKQYPQQLQTELLDALREQPDLTLAEKNKMIQDYRYNWLMRSGMAQVNPALLNESLFPEMKRAENAVYNTWQAEAERFQREQIGEDAAMLMSQPYSQSNWDTAQELYRAAGYSRKDARAMALANITSLEQLEEWAGLMSFDGKTTLGQKFRRDFDKRRVDILNAQVADHEYNEKSKAMAAVEYAEPIIQEFLSNPESITAEALQKARKRSVYLYGTYDPRLDQFDRFTVEKEEEKYWTDLINSRLAAGDDIRGILADPRVPFSVKKAFASVADRNVSNGGDPKEDKNAEQLKNDVLQLIGDETVPLETRQLTQGRVLAQDYAVREYARIRSELIAGGMKPDDASKQAYMQVNQMIQAGTKSGGEPGSGPFIFDQEEGFTYFTQGTQTGNDARREQARRAIVNKNAVDNAFKENGNNPRLPVLDSKRLIDQATLQDAVTNSNTPGYQPPAVAEYISSQYFNGQVSPWEILRRQVKAFTGEDITLPQSLLRSTTISPRMQQLLNRAPSYNRVSRAYRHMNSEGFDPSLVPNHYGTMVAEAAEQNGIDPAVLSGLLEQESRWNPNAVSPAGAKGLGQFMDPTAREFGVDVYDPQSSIEGAARYLRYLLDYFNQDLPLALYAYNGGMGNTQRYNGPIPGNQENEEYAGAVLERATRYGYRGYVPGLNPAIPQ